MNIDFFDNPADAPRMREDVRIEQLRLELSPEGRRVAVDLQITPFIERPTVELYIDNERGEKAGLLTIIETLDRTLSVVVHLRDSDPTPDYRIRVTLYFTSVEEKVNKQIVDRWDHRFAAEPLNMVVFTDPGAGGSAS